MLSRLRLRHFRNYETLDIAFGPGLTLLTGANGQGKTNILEALHYLSVLRSFRTRRTSDLKQWGSRFFFIEGTLEQQLAIKGPQKISISYADRRRLRVDRRVVSRAADFIGRFRCVACVPEDILIVKGGPAGRRRFVDMLLCQHSSQYLSDLINYQTVLKTRNRMLKEPRKYGSSAFAAYNKMLVRHGAPVIAARAAFSITFNAWLENEARSLFGGTAATSFHYKPDVALPAGQEKTRLEYYETLLNDSLERDMNRRRTGTGPHLDEYMVALDGMVVGEFGSEGQCRLMSLALKLAAAEFLHGNDEVPLVMLVDDVLGELDQVRRQLFYQNFEKATQIIVACTEAPDDLAFRAGKTYCINDGRAGNLRHRQTPVEA